MLGMKAPQRRAICSCAGQSGVAGDAGEGIAATSFSGAAPNAQRTTLLKRRRQRLTKGSIKRCRKILRIFSEKSAKKGGRKAGTKQASGSAIVTNLFCVSNTHWRSRHPREPRRRRRRSRRRTT